MGYSTTAGSTTGVFVAGSVRVGLAVGLAVGSGVDVDADGRAYVAMFTRRPHIRRCAWVAATDRKGSIERVMLGLTKAIDVAFDSKGHLHALEFSQDFDLNLPSLYNPIGGRIVRGRRWRTEVIATDFHFRPPLRSDPMATATWRSTEPSARAAPAESDDSSHPNELQALGQMLRITKSRMNLSKSRLTSGPAEGTPHDDWASATT